MTKLDMMERGDKTPKPVSGIEALNFVRTPDDAAKIVIYYDNGERRYITEREVQVEFMLRSQGLTGKEKELKRMELLSGEGLDYDYGFERFDARPKPHNPYRRVDDLGRIVIPSKLRKELGIFNRYAQFRMDVVDWDTIKLSLVDRGEEIV